MNLRVNLEDLDEEIKTLKRELKKDKKAIKKYAKYNLQAGLFCSSEDESEY